MATDNDAAQPAVTNDPNADRARRARSPVNTIRPSRPRARDEPELSPAIRDLNTATTATAATTAPASPAKPATPDPKAWVVPDSVRARFPHDGQRYYFPDGAPAFRDRGLSLTTQSENTALISSLLEIAEARGWDRITVSGTETFRQATWQQARQRGMDVRGYRPTPGERAAVALTLARRSDEAAPSAAHSKAPDVTSASPTPGASSLAPSAPKKADDEPLIGKLLDHGRENYRFDPHEEMTYFVRIETPQGRKQVIWGKDLERAVRESLTQPRPGDLVVLRRTGADEVTVKRKERDDDGRVLSEKDLDTQRHRWQFEKQEFFDQRAATAAIVRDPRTDPRQAMKSHPQLAGTYLNLRAAEIAAREFRDPQDRQRFIDIVRGALANRIERGEPLPAVRLRESRTARPAEPERELTPSRG